MALILLVETSTVNCSVALADGGRVVASKELANGYTHAENLNVFIDDVMQSAGKKLSDLDAVAVGMGPGSYTGLRIGVSTVKGLAYAVGCPVVGVPTLKHMAAGYVAKHPPTAGTVLIPMLDARRMEVYTAVFSHTGEQLQETDAVIVESDSFDAFAGNKKVFFGPGAGKCEDVLGNTDSAYIGDIYPSACDMAVLADEMLAKNVTMDLAYFEPFYLKDFQATKPKKLV